MNIVYCCKSGTSGNDDEGAIEHALRVLGHAVVRVDETSDMIPLKGDLFLFHKLPLGSPAHALLPKVRDHMPTTCWYFDRVRDDDPACERRTVQRLEWMGRTTPHTTFLFCTDGDWARETGAEWLRQGADERWWTFNPVANEPAHRRKILMTCNIHGRRGEFFRHVKGHLGPRLKHYARGLYRNRLASAVGAASAVVAPPTPVSDRYCSNRIYTVLACGGILVHPVTAAIAEDYSDGSHYLGYTTADVAVGWCRDILREPELWDDMRRTARERTWTHNLYRHRLERLLAVVRGKV